mgnify:CR=1 FL=1
MKIHFYRLLSLKYKMSKTLGFDGQNYRVFVVFDEIKKTFFIKALHKKTKGHSFITNLNCILSQFDINMEADNLLESSWELLDKNVNLFVSKSIHFLKDKSFLDHLEKQLDIDRSCGEWENQL